MKKILTLLLWAISVQSYAQNPPIIVTGINIILPASPDPNTATWGTRSVFTIMASTTEPNFNSAKSTTILITIKKGGVIDCGIYTNRNAPASNFDKLAMTWPAKTALSLMGEECILAPGDYKLCVQFFLKGQPASDEVCKPFTINAPETISYQPPQALAPAKGTVISEADVKKPLTFRWTPVTPKPKEPVIYKLRVFEIRQGQTATTAIKSAATLLAKEVSNQTQYILPSLSQLHFAKGSSYGWYVQAIDQKGNPVGGNNGMSNINTFNLKSSSCAHEANIVSVECLGMLNGLPQYKVCVEYKNISTPGCTNCGILLNHTNNNNGVIVESNNAPVTQIISVLPGTPAILQQGQQTTICFNATVASGGLLDFWILATCNDEAVGSDHPNEENEPLDTIPPPCLCNDCDTVNIDFVNKSATKVNNNTYNLTGTLDVNIPFYGAEFQVLSWEYTATPPSCTNGVNALEQSAMLLLPSTTVNGNVPVACDVSIPGNNANAVKCVRYLTTAPINDPPFELTVGLPGALPGLPPNCCAINYKVCIKATIFLDDKHCNYCSYIECFEFNNQ